MNRQYNDKLVEVITQKSSEWAKNIKDIMPLLRSAPENMTDANALALSYRTMLLEEVSYFTGLMAEHERDIRELKRDKFIFYATGTLPDGTQAKGKTALHPLINKKLSKGEIDIVLLGDLSEQEMTLQVLSDVVAQLKEYIKTIDSILFSIKNRLELFNYLK